VLPAYRRLHDYLKNDYLPKARDSIGLSALRTRVLVRVPGALSHSTSMKPDEVHELGLSEVARIRVEMERIKSQVGHAGDLNSFFDALRSDPRFYFKQPSELLAATRRVAASACPGRCRCCLR